MQDCLLVAIEGERTFITPLPASHNPPPKPRKQPFPNFSFLKAFILRYINIESCVKNFVWSVFATTSLQQLLMQCNASAIIKAIIGWMANRNHFPLPLVLASVYLTMLTCKCLATAWFVPVFAFACICLQMLACICLQVLGCKTC